MVRLFTRAAATLSLLAIVFGSAMAQEPAVDPLVENIREQIEQLRDAVSTGPSLQGVSLSEGVARFYEQRGFTAAWTSPDRRTALVTQLRELYDDGLNPADYDVDRLEKGPASSEPRALATFVS